MTNSQSKTLDSLPLRTTAEGNQVLGMMGNRGCNPLVAIQMALSGQIYAETGE